MELLEDSGGGKKPLTDWHGVMSDLFGVGQYFSFFFLFFLSFLLNFIRCFRLNIDLVSVVESMQCADMSVLIVLV